MAKSLFAPNSFKQTNLYDAAQGQYSHPTYDPLGSDIFLNISKRDFMKERHSDISLSGLLKQMRDGSEYGDFIKSILKEIDFFLKKMKFDTL